MVFSSPYVRSLQTASYTVKKLGLNCITIDYNLSEWMKDSFFDSNPIENLLLKTPTNDRDAKA